MPITVGDGLSILSGGVGHSGGEIPSFTEVMTRGHWTGVEVFQGTLTHYAIQIDMTDLTTDTDASRGLYAGFFRWVTDRPNYDGVTVIPTGDNEGDVWGEGIIINRNRISPVDRLINVNRSGDYGSLSGFNLAIDNTSDFGADPAGFDDYLLTNGYEIINRPVKVYCIIDDVFYQIWGGVVSETNYNEKIYQFVGKDIFESAHKPMPPAEIVLQKYPGADADNIGKNIPIVFGDVLRTELLNISGKSAPQVIGFTSISDEETDVTAATEYGVDGTTDQPYLLIKTPFYDFPDGYFVDTGVYYLTVFKGDDQSLLIVGSDETTNPDTASATTKIYLGKKLTETVTNFNLNNAYSGTPVSDDVWFFRIYQFDAFYLLSDKAIHSFFQDDRNNLDFRRWNKDRLTFDPIPELINTFDNTENNKYEAPNISILNNQIDIEGDFIRLIPIFPESVSFVSLDYSPGGATITTNEFGVESDERLVDLDRSTSLSIVSATNLNSIDLNYDVVFPETFVIDDLDELFVCFDIEIGLFSPGGTTQFRWGYSFLDAFEQGFILGSTYDYPEGLSSDPLILNGLPDEYYRQGNLNGESSDFEKEVNSVFLSTIFKVTDIDSFKKAVASKRFRLRFNPGSPTTGNDIKSLKLKQIGFYGSQKLNVIKDKLYIKSKGETVDGDETNNVRTAIKHILETYDEIDSSRIDYGNLDLYSTRDSWIVGRQVTERKLSSVYLKELAAQSFVGIYPDRYGKRHTKSFLDDLTNIWTHADDNGTIIKGSISKFEATPINELYNDFRIEYDWNPGLEQFNKSIFITNTDARTEVDPYNATFPTETESISTDTDYTAPADFTQVRVKKGAVAILTMTADPTNWATVGEKVSFDDGAGNSFSYGTIIGTKNGVSKEVSVEIQVRNEIASGTYTTGTITSHAGAVVKWTTWVGGINDYETAKGYWEICYNSWLKTQTVNKLPVELGKCHWFIDPALYNGTGESSDASAAHKLLENLISWSTRQKFRAVYSIPITKQNIQIDLLDVVSFKDQKYTNGDFLDGYVEKIKVDPVNDRINLEVILKPADLETFPPGVDLIIETGSAPDTYTESGSNPNTVTETGV